MSVPQFSIADHYDIMAELDRDVHDDAALSATEADLALALIGAVPPSVFLPCFGTGRHIGRLLECGVQRIVGVDLSPRCVDKARRQFVGDPRVELVVGNLATWRTPERFDAVILLGNSFGDIIDPRVLAKVTSGMIAPLAQTGTFLMDYIGEGYLDRACSRISSCWDAVLHGTTVEDRRTPRFDEETRVMSIDVEVRAKRDGTQVWTGCYQKAVLSDKQLRTHFVERGLLLRAHGRATELNRDYYGNHHGELGMIARSTWWTGHRG